MQVIKLMCKFLLLLIVVTKAVPCFSQKKSGLSKKQGLIIFEDRFDMYFVDTKQKSLKSLLSNAKDTITAYMLYTNEGKPYEFQTYLAQNIRFDSICITLRQENQLGQEFEDTAKFVWDYGYINYVKSKGYKLKKRYKNLYWIDRTVVIRLEEYIPIEAFKSMSPILKKNSSKMFPK